MSTLERDQEDGEEVRAVHFGEALRIVQKVMDFVFQSSLFKGIILPKFLLLRCKQQPALSTRRIKHVNYIASYAAGANLFRRICI